MEEKVRKTAKAATSARKPRKNAKDARPDAVADELLGNSTYASSANSSAKEPAVAGAGAT
jgi:hypothetical protein